MAIIKYKGTDGEWHELGGVLIKAIDIVQTTGTSSASVMSQDAVTKLVSDMNEASGITAMNGYEIASSASSVSETDTLLEAIGKLEKRLDIIEKKINNNT